AVGTRGGWCGKRAPLTGRQGGPARAHRYEISAADWDRTKHLRPGQRGQHGGVAEDNRRFINAVLWIARTGAAWEDLPERLGKGDSQWGGGGRGGRGGRVRPGRAGRAGAGPGGARLR